MLRVPSCDPFFLVPDWPLPAGLRAAVTTRKGGYGSGPYSGFNLATHVGDDPVVVARNRSLLQSTLHLPEEPYWLQQVHGCDIVQRTAEIPESERRGDGAVSHSGGVLAILTADCLPILLASQDGRAIGALHAGWRGLVGGVIEAGIAAMDMAPEEILVYLGPAIGPTQYQVGAELRAAFLAADPGDEEGFRPGPGDRFYADLPLLARRRLARLGVKQVWGGEHCTFGDEQLFFSYRRQGQCGRMASLIWREWP